MPKVTINDVAALAKVSIKTVSRVVNREPNVRATTRERVEAAIRQVNYSPNLSARNLASSRSHLIALVYDDPSAYEVPSSGYVISLQEGSLRACRATDNELLIHPCNYRSSSVKQELQRLIKQMRPDGIVLAAPLSNMAHIVEAIIETGAPLVRLSPGKASADQYAVVTDDQAVCAEMTHYLASLGHRRIAFIKGDDKHAAVTKRFLGYQHALTELGLEFADELVAAGDNSIHAGEACANVLLALADRPTAIFAANDTMAAGVVRVAHRLGLDVPADVSVVGFDDEPLAQQIYPALTTIKQPVSLMAELAANHLIDRRSEATSDVDLVPSEMVIRESTATAPPQPLKPILSR